MKLAIVGSRSFNDYDLLKNAIIAQIDPNDIEAIVSGGAIGADSLAERFADEFNLKKIIYKPDWNLYGRSAGYKRNVLIIQECDQCFAFWDGESRGTKMDIDLCKTYGKPCQIIRINDNVLF